MLESLGFSAPQTSHSQMLLLELLSMRHVTRERGAEDAERRGLTLLLNLEEGFGCDILLSDNKKV